MAEPRFVHLRVHSDYSMIDGLAKTGPLVKKAASLGMPALAITHFTNLCGLVKFYGTAHGAGMKPIVGADFHVQSDLVGDEKRAMRIAQFTHPAQVGRVVHAHAAGALQQGLDDHRGDLTRMAVEQRCQLVGGREREGKVALIDARGSETAISN